MVEPQEYKFTCSLFFSVGLFFLLAANGLPHIVENLILMSTSTVFPGLTRGGNEYIVHVRLSQKYPVTIEIGYY